MKSLTPTRHQKALSRFLLVALWLSLSLAARVPSARAQQTATDAYNLLTLSANQNKTDHEQALQTAGDALAIFTNLNDQTGIIAAKSSMAQYHLALGNVINAKNLYEEVRQFWQGQQNPSKEATALINLSFVEQRKGEWDTALQYLAQAEPMVNAQTEQDKMGSIASSYAWVYNHNGLHDTARTQYQIAHDYFLQKDDARGTNRMKMYIGYTYVLQGNYNAAATPLNEALANLTYDLDKAQCHEYLGQMHMGLQEYSVALEHLETALASYQSAHNVSEAARVIALIGQINEQQGALAPARKRYLNAVQTFGKVEDRVHEAAFNFSLGKLELKGRNYDLAEKYLKRSLAITEDLRRTAISRHVTAAYSASVYERYQTYVECLVRKHESQPSQQLHIEAFQTSELARARALAELLRDIAPAVGPNQKLAKRELVLRQTIDGRTGERIKLLDRLATAKPEDREGLDNQLAQLEKGTNEVRREHAAIAEELRKVDPLFARLQQPAAYSLEQIQREVIDDDQTVLLEFMLGEEASYAWAVRKNGIKLYTLDNQAVINKATQDCYNLMAVEPNDDIEQRSKKATADLAKLVIEPLAEELNAKRLIIVADGGLHYVPFQLLPSPSNPNEPLVANYEIINAPSASILGQLRKEKQQRQPGKKLLAAFGDPVFPANYAEYKGGGSSSVLASLTSNPIASWRRASRDIQIDADNVNPAILQPLAFSKFELQKLDALGGSASDIARGFQASRETLMTMDLSQYSVLHFATHGVLDPKDPSVTGIFLSMLDDSGKPQNGFITTPDIYALHAPVDLVVLSACRTGLGKGVRGEGLIGLTSGFMHAGASSVAASLWKVDDSATSELMDHFYTNMLEKNMRPADALRAAQNTLRNDPRWRSPHFWAAFTFQGEYRDTIRIPPASGASRAVQNAVGGSLLLLLLAGIAWGFWRRRGPRPVVK